MNRHAVVIPIDRSVEAVVEPTLEDKLTAMTRGTGVMSGERRPPHPAKVAQAKAPHPAKAVQAKAAHPAMAVQRLETPFGVPKVPAPHPATVQMRMVPFGIPKAVAAHPKRPLLQARASLQGLPCPDGRLAQMVRQHARDSSIQRSSSSSSSSNDKGRGSIQDLLQLSHWTTPTEDEKDGKAAKDEKKQPGTKRDLLDVWKLVHSPEFDLTHTEGGQALKIYKGADQKTCLRVYAWFCKNLNREGEEKLVKDVNTALGNNTNHGKSPEKVLAVCVHTPSEGFLAGYIGVKSERNAFSLSVSRKDDELEEYAAPSRLLFQYLLKKVRILDKSSEADIGEKLWTEAQEAAQEARHG